MEQAVEQFKDRLAHAIAKKEPLRIVGGNSKAFYGREVQGEPLSMTAYSGIVSYEPTELYVTARAGTSLHELEQTLAASGQMLAFEPPHFSSAATVGGMVAAGLSGPRRPYVGSTRDFILGIKCLNGQGQLMSFGGQVMKNVAGYDLSRLLTGSLGTLGIILEVSLKVLPMPKTEITCRQALSLSAVGKRLNDISNQALPVTAAAYDNQFLYIRLSGTKAVVDEAVQFLNADIVADGDNWWQSLRNCKHALFDTDKNIWRLSMPVAAQFDTADDAFILDWGGAQYWMASDRPGREIFEAAAEQGGSATLFKTKEAQVERFQALPTELLKLHQGLKDAFDPHRILNPGRMYATL